MKSADRKRGVGRAGAIMAGAALAAGGAAYLTRRARGFAENTRLKRLDVFPILTYHRIVSTAAEDRLWGDLTVDDFAWQMHRLARKGYLGVSLRSAWAARDDATGLPPPAMIVISFDDAYIETLCVAASVLEQVGFCATVFVPTSFVGSKGYFTRYNSQQSRWPDILSWKDLSLMQSRGFEVGSHTQSHPFLDEVAARDEKLLGDEIQGSRQDIERGLGSAPEFLAYPHGSFSQRVLEVAQDAGYLGAVTTMAPDGTAPPFALRRRDWFAADPASLSQRARLRVRFALSYPGPERATTVAPGTP